MNGPGRHLGRRPGRAEIVGYVGIGVLCAWPGATNFAPGGWAYPVFTVVAAIGLASALAQPRSRTPAAVIAFLGLCGWAAASSLWAGGPDPARAVAGVALAGLAAAWAGLLRAGAFASARPVRHLALMAVSVLGGSAVAYLTAFARGGWGRQGLPIGGASTSILPLALCTAACIVAGRRYPRERALWYAGAGLGFVLIVQTFSRLGLFLALLIGVVAVGSSRGPRPVRAVALGLFVALAGWVTVEVRGWDTLSSTGRLGATRGAWGWIVADLPHFVVGHGLGGVWPWLEYERGWRGVDELNTAVDSLHGTLLYHPHSVYLGTQAEYGLVGSALLAGSLALVGLPWLAVARAPASPWRLLAMVMLASIPAFAVEYHLFRNHAGAAVWWVFALAAPRATAGRMRFRVRRPPRSAPTPRPHAGASS